MKINPFQDPNSAPLFPKMVSGALGRLKRRLQHDYQKLYPDADQIIQRVLDEEEAKAWEISFFPHLILPDLVDAHISTLGLQAVDARRDAAGRLHEFTAAETHKSAFASCG
jgi:hypothetical protein